eukprot:TRINITY_DN70316_c0_g1_i1.p1 TRINITY_DN70316_c0_g1~~TRINITY_DN70316_c0_g1_i1.p1  ORF type:complete len:106 (+),score=12.91 TRINITY_DN70316_c0_g1_i1:33-350(+)
MNINHEVLAATTATIKLFREHAHISCVGFDPLVFLQEASPFVSVADLGMSAERIDGQIAYTKSFSQACAAPTFGETLCAILESLEIMVPCSSRVDFFHQATTFFG